MQKKKDKSAWYIAFFVMAPIYLFYEITGADEGQGRAVMIGSGMFVLTVITTWKFRQGIWYWGLIIIIAALHVIAFTNITWSNMDLRYYALLPFGLGDYLASYAIINGTYNLLRGLGLVRGNENLDDA